jgi:hypothetical protein
MAGIFDLVDSMVAQELGVDEKTYIQVIEHECTYWQAQFIIGAMFEEGNSIRKEKARKIFNQYVDKKDKSS